LDLLGQARENSQPDRCYGWKNYGEDPTCTPPISAVCERVIEPRHARKRGWGLKIEKGEALGLAGRDCAGIVQRPFMQPSGKSASVAFLVGNQAELTLDNRNQDSSGPFLKLTLVSRPYET